MFRIGLVLIPRKHKETVLGPCGTPPLFVSACGTLIKWGLGREKKRRTVAVGWERVSDLFKTIPGLNNLIKILREKDWGRLIDWRDLQRRWNKWTVQQVGIRSTLSSRPDTSRDTCERGLGRICERRNDGSLCVCARVCARAANLFIYLSLAAIMVFIPSLSQSIWWWGIGFCVSFDNQTWIFSSDSNQTNYTRDGERGQVDGDRR